MNHPTDHEYVYHITVEEDYNKAKQAGTAYSHESLATEGFIHFSTDAQYPKTLNRFFKGQKGIVLLKINRSALQSPLKYEYSEPNEPPFPHLYGTLNTDAVVQLLDLTEDPSTSVWTATPRI
eukprot:TRINITY_DN5567_c0_g1_i1.p1 TRINITY_DN5567_c0_g1~~TRINITY_DN5567_c0_g1_i1.p1  ORF type:complete len:122 (+),score=34.85 TRINITY_DN5567_c0_g1_i1:49-414(+)